LCFLLDPRTPEVFGDQRLTIALSESEVGGKASCLSFGSYTRLMLLIVASSLLISRSLVRTSCVFFFILVLPQSLAVRECSVVLTGSEAGRKASCLSSSSYTRSMSGSFASSHHCISCRLLYRLESSWYLRPVLALLSSYPRGFCLSKIARSLRKSRPARPAVTTRVCCWNPRIELRCCSSENLCDE
jgi:hypothetical protein